MSKLMSVAVCYPAYVVGQDHTALAATARNFAAQGHPATLEVVTNNAAVRAEVQKALGGAPATFVDQEPGGFAAVLNGVTARHPESIVVALAERVELLAAYPLAVASAFLSRGEVAAVFGSYLKPKADGKGDEYVRVYPLPKPLHEREDLGFVQAYSAPIIGALGGVRNELQYVPDLDLQLRIIERHVYRNLAEAQYRVHPAPATPASEQGEKDAQANRLHAPGKGKYGGFSYLFYPEAMETELNRVFTDYLKRQGAFLDDARNPTRPVPYPEGKKYAVLASVVIPVFNREKYIGKAIESVVSGTFKDFEIVIVDNGSTDNSAGVVREWSKKDARVRLIEQRGPSIASALNRGIREARGKYICQLDSDDVYVPTTLEKMIGHFESHPKCGLAISYYGLMDPEGVPLPELGLIKHTGYGRNVILRRDGAGALRVFPKVVLEEFGLYDEENFGNFGEDYDMVLKTGEKYDVDRVHEELYRYRRHPDNTDVTRDPGMKIRNKNTARHHAIARRILQNRYVTPGQ